MYSREKRMKAIELYIKYDQSATAVIHELGYPDRGMLAKWYKAYLEEQNTGVMRDPNARYLKYTPEQKKLAVDHYFAHGRSLARTIRALGYPSRPFLMQWCKECWTENGNKCTTYGRSGNSKETDEVVSFVWNTEAGCLEAEANSEKPTPELSEFVWSPVINPPSII